MADEKQTEQDSNFFRAVSRCWLSIKQAGQRILNEKNFDLTFEQLMILFILRDNDGQNLRCLAEQADRERTTITRMVDGLERKDLVVRIPDKNDNRNKLAYLTRKGKEICQELDNYKIEFEEYIFRDVSQDELKKTTKIINKISGNLSGSD